MRTLLRNSLCAILSLIALHGAWAADLRVLPAGQLPKDARLEPLKDENGYFPFTPPKTREAWQQRAEQLRRQILVAAGLVAHAGENAESCRHPRPRRSRRLHGRKGLFPELSRPFRHRQSLSAERTHRAAARRLGPVRPLGQRPFLRRRPQGNPLATRPRRRAIRSRRPLHPPGPLRAVGPHGLRRLPIRHGRRGRQPAAAAHARVAAEA